MSIFTDLKEKLFKRELPEKTSKEYSSLFKRRDLENVFNSITSYDLFELENGIADRRRLECLYKSDSDIMSAVDKRIGALLTSTVQFDSESEEKKAFFEEQLRPHVFQLLEDYWWSVCYGYGVEQIIYKEDRSGEIEGFQKEQYWRFRPHKDLKSLSVLTSATPRGYKSQNELLPYGKWVLTTHKGTAYNPRGEALFTRLYIPWIFRWQDWDFWMRFAERFASGLLIGKVESAHEGAVEEMRQHLDNAARSASIAIPQEDDVSAITFPQNGGTYKEIDDQIIKMYYRAILGETQTSIIETRGSSASAEVHDGIRAEKTLYDIMLVQQAMNETINQIALVNGIDQTVDPVRCNIIPKQGLETERAERDMKLSQSNIVKFNKNYIVKHYGIEEDEFEIPETQLAQSLGLSKKDEKELYFNEPVCGTCNFKADVKAVNQDQVEDIVRVLSEDGSAPVDIESVISAVFASKDKKDLEQNLDALFGQDSPEFVDKLTQSLFYSATQGVLNGDK